MYPKDGKWASIQELKFLNQIPGKMDSAKYGMLQIQQ